MAKYGFIEEAPGGTGRQRPWQRVALAHTWDYESDDPAAIVLSSVTHLTAAELEAIGEEIVAIIDRYAGRVPDRSQRPEGALPVALVATGHPLEPTPAGN